MKVQRVASSSGKFTPEQFPVSTDKRQLDGPNSCHGHEGEEKNPGYI
jgi:hypothetical protein